MTRKTMIPKMVKVKIYEDGQPVHKITGEKLKVKKSLYEYFKVK